MHIIDVKQFNHFDMSAQQMKRHKNVHVASTNYMTVILSQ